ncbi:MAG TPA: helix-turn-helix domain-containing protein [Aggregatilineales bacterium]|nr:helix-turn-helix domain-containing protein [Aggregatilineales bacterium]
MKGYSLDLRERVIHSWQSGKTQAWIAQQFEMSVSTVKRYISQYRAQGHVKAKAQQYKQPTIRGEQLEALRQQLAAHPDATLGEHIGWWGERTGQWVSTSMMWRAVDRAGWTRKKRQWGPKNAML